MIDKSLIVHYQLNLWINFTIIHLINTTARHLEYNLYSSLFCFFFSEEAVFQHKICAFKTWYFILYRVVLHDFRFTLIKVEIYCLSCRIFLKGVDCPPVYIYISRACTLYNNMFDLESRKELYFILILESSYEWLLRSNHINILFWEHSGKI